MLPAVAGQYLDTVFRPLLAVDSSQALCGEALQIHARSGPSWYDSWMVSSSIQARCDLVYAEELQHGQRFGGLQVRNPFL